MIQFRDVKLIYTCPAAPPENIFMDRIYTLNKEEKGLYFTDGNYVQYADESFIKMLFTPQNTTWEKVDFSEKVDVLEKVEFSKPTFKK